MGAKSVLSDETDLSGPLAMLQSKQSVNPCTLHVPPGPPLVAMASKLWLAANGEVDEEAKTASGTILRPLVPVRCAE